MARELRLGGETPPATGGRGDLLSSLLNPDNRVIKIVSILALAVVSILISTLSLNNLLGYNVAGTVWYWIALLAVGITALVAWLQKRTDITPFSTVAKIALALALVMMFLWAIWPKVNVRSATASVKASANGGLVYGTGKHTAHLEAQGITGPIQLLPEEGKYNISSPDNNFQILTPSGQLISAWDKKNWPRAGEIQIIAGDTNQTLLIEVW